MSATMLAEYAAHYRRDLFESVVPFWQRSHNHQEDLQDGNRRPR